jgi:hypothetical protein
LITLNQLAGTEQTLQFGSLVRRVLEPLAEGTAQPGFSRCVEKQGDLMKLSMILKPVPVVMAVILITAAFAANNKGSFQVAEDVTVNGQQLPAGDYKVKWEGTGPDVELSILKNNKVVATATARVIELQRPEKNDSVVISNNDDGSGSLSAI